MDFFLSVSSSSPIESSSLQCDSDEKEENKEDQMFEIMPKNPNSDFSKPVSPTNKILASESILDDSQEPFSLQEPRSPQMAVSQFTLGEEEFDCSEPYDPLTNFLCPWPLFLRYSPNQLRRTLSNGANGDGFISRTSSPSSASMSLINGEIFSLTEEEKEEIKGTNEGIEEIDNQEIEEGVKVGNSCSKVGTKTWLLLLILAISDLFVIFVNFSNSSYGLNIQKDGIEYDGDGYRNLSREADLVKNFCYYRPSFEDPGASCREPSVKEVIEVDYVDEELMATVNSVRQGKEEEGDEGHRTDESGRVPSVKELNDEDYPDKEIMATVHSVRQGKEEEGDGGHRTDESLESYARKLSPELGPNEEKQTMANETFLESPIMISSMYQTLVKVAIAFRYIWILVIMIRAALMENENRARE